MRQNLDRRIEQGHELESLRVERRELEDQPGAEGMADESCPPDAGGIECFQNVVCVGRDRPRGLPVGEAVAA